MANNLSKMLSMTTMIKALVTPCFGPGISDASAKVKIEFG